MDEQTALKKWCPFVRRDNASPSKHGLAPVDDHPGRVTYSVDCIGSKCMAWRTYETEASCADPDRPEDGDDVGTEIITHGYCGLAGKP